MAESRTNMVSLLDVGPLSGSSTSNIVEMGDGYTELTESWGPKVDTKQYVNMDAESAVVSGYSFSMSPEREFISDALQTAINTLAKTLPVGSKCETYYYRFFKTDLTTSSDSTGSMTGKGIKMPVVVTIDSVGGSGGEPLKTTISITGNGSPVECKVTATSGKYTIT